MEVDQVHEECVCGVCLCECGAEISPMGSYQVGVSGKLTLVDLLQRFCFININIEQNQCNKHQHFPYKLPACD